MERTHLPEVVVKLSLRGRLPPLERITSAIANLSWLDDPLPLFLDQMLQSFPIEHVHMVIFRLGSSNSLDS